jgi:hypothetical protein
MLSALMFLGGIHVTMMLLAACYGYLDLWYRIGEKWPAVSIRLLRVCALEALLIWLLDGHLLITFLWGQGCYLAFHLSKFLIARALLAMLARQQS